MAMAVQQARLLQLARERIGPSPLSQLRHTNLPGSRFSQCRSRDFRGGHAWSNNMLTSHGCSVGLFAQERSNLLGSIGRDVPKTYQKLDRTLQMEVPSPSPCLGPINQTPV